MWGRRDEGEAELAGKRPAELGRGGTMSRTRLRFQEAPGSIPRPEMTRRRRRRGRWSRLVPGTLGRAAIRRRRQLLCGGRPGSLRRSRSGKTGREQRVWLRGAGRPRREGSNPPGATPWCGAPWPAHGMAPGPVSTVTREERNREEVPGNLKTNFNLVLKQFPAILKGTRPFL